MELRGTPRTPARQPRTVIGFRPTRTTFVALRALSCFAFPPAEAGRRPSMYFRSPSEDILRKPRIATTRSPGHKGRLREPRQVLPLLNFCHPTAHPGTANRVHVSGSLRRHSPRARFGYLLRDSFTAPADTTSRVGAPMGFTLQGFPLERDRSTFRWPCPLDVAAYTTLPPKEESRHMAAFKASFPRRVRAAPRPPGTSPDCLGRRSLLEVFPLQSSSPA